MGNGLNRDEAEETNERISVGNVLCFALLSHDTHVAITLLKLFFEVCL